MALKHPLKKVLLLAPERWDNPKTRPEVRAEFRKVINCRTLSLGAEVYASRSGETRIVPHTCKSRVCSSCGQRANLQWLRERLADLPEIAYSHLVLTMPDVFWPIFRDNRHLLDDLPALGAQVLSQWVGRKYRAKVFLIVIPHTFGRDLKFNCHLHILISQGGLTRDEGKWLADLPLNMRAIERMWRYAVVTLLRMAYRWHLLSASLDPTAFANLLDQQYRRTWHVYGRRMRDKGKILRYAGRYVRRPPIAEHRFRTVTPHEVRFLTKDLKSGQTVGTRYTLPEFIDRLGHHVPRRYSHNVRYFGLLAPRTKATIYAYVFNLLKQHRLPTPPRVRWAVALKRDFGVDPLLDSKGNRMYWVGRLPAHTNP